MAAKKLRTHPTLNQTALFTNHKLPKRAKLNHITHMIHNTNKRTNYTIDSQNITNGTPQITIYKQTSTNNAQAINTYMRLHEQTKNRAQTKTPQT